MNQQALKQKLLAKFDFEEWMPILESMFPRIDYLSKPIQIDADLVKSGGQMGVIRLDDGRSLGLFKFEVADNIQISRNRKGLRDIAIKYVDQDIIHGALVLYYSEKHADYRLTFVSKQTSINAEGALETKATAPKRYTFLLGANEPCTTAANRLLELINKKKNGSVYLADVTEAFSVERLNKDFFRGYKEQYFKFLDLIGKESKDNRDYVKKLLGRLVFLQFLQKKGWMGVPADRNDWEGGDKRYLYNLIQKYEGNDRLLSDVLEVLFFNTLNEKRPDDMADPILGDNIKIPYLNGGLFDKDDLDKKDIDFPYAYFKELMEFFGMYNFTIDENDPDDAEVGVDPEMLGHIFENLLEDNKDKGAFYTPKEIVQYMSQESIAQYLKTHTDETIHPAIDALIKRRVVSELLQNKASATAVYSLLQQVKVCDPAIGSGAFPMGVLNVLYHARLLLYGFTKPTQEFSPANVKREIIQNNIYGVDIEKGAVDIARLRFWLALVVDEMQPHTLPNLDYKIMCGNSLIHRFALDTPFHNVLKHYNKENKTNLTLDDYRQWVYEYTDIADHTKKDRFRKMIDEIKHAFKTELSLKEKMKLSKARGDLLFLQGKDMFGNPNGSAEEIKKMQKKIKELEQQRDETTSNKIYEQAFEWRFEFPALLDEDGNFTGFDVVIGNPPYVSAPTQIANEQLAKQREQIIISKNYKSLYQKWDLYIPFIELGLQMNCKDGITTMIVPFPLTNQLYAKIMRKMLVEENNLWELVDLNGTKIFENATVSNCIPFIKKATTQNKTWISKIDRNLKISRSFVQFHSDLVQDGKTYVWNVTQEKRETNKHAEMHVLGDYCYISYGLRLNSDEKKAKGEFVKSDLLSETEDNIHCRKLIEGKDIERYNIKRIHYVEWGTNRVPSKLVRPTFPEFYNYPKIFCNYLGDLNCVMDSKDCFIHTHLISGAVLWKYLHGIENKSIISSIKKFSTMSRIEMEKLSETVDLRFLLGIMNSKYASVLLTNLRGGDYHIYPEHIRNIPIPSASPSQQQPIIDLVNIILAAKKANPQADTSVWEDEIDGLVYNLYGLSYEEVLIVDPETPITKEEYENLH